MLKRLLFLCLMLLPVSAFATTRNAATCSATDVNTQITASSTGDTVHLPTCSVSWAAGAVSLTKAITIDGNGEANTVIDVSGTSGSVTFNITKQAAASITIQNIKFTSTGNNDAQHPINVDGSWLGTEPVIFIHVTFVCSTSTILDIRVNGGVILSNITFIGEWNDFLLTAKEIDGTSWAAADSMGANDSTGKKNIYIEDSTFNGGSNGVFDCDDGCRIVDRHNTYNTSGGFNSHGNDSSPYGMRHFEIYNNTYNFNGAGCTGLGGDITNINQYIWLRGATGVIFNNTFTDLSSGCWGNKNEITGSIRGIEDDRPQGACGSVSYPAPHQLGQNNNGSADFTDPIYMWSNTGTKVFSFGFGWGNPCGFTFSNFFQTPRDYVDNGSANSPKGGYTAYTYPHPLLSGSSDTTVPTAGASGAITFAGVTSSAITVNWTKGTDDTSAQGTLQYEVCRSASTISSVGTCESNIVMSFTTDVATYANSGLSASTTYHYNVVVKDEAGNKTLYVDNSQATSAPSASANGRGLRR